MYTVLLTVVSRNSVVETDVSGSFPWISCCCERELCNYLTTNVLSVLIRHRKHFNCPELCAHAHLCMSGIPMAGKYLACVAGLITESALNHTVCTRLSM